MLGWRMWTTKSSGCGDLIIAPRTCAANTLPFNPMIKFCKMYNHPHFYIEWVVGKFPFINLLCLLLKSWTHLFLCIPFLSLTLLPSVLHDQWWDHRVWGLEAIVQRGRIREQTEWWKEPITSSPVTLLSCLHVLSFAISPQMNPSRASPPCGPINKLYGQHQTRQSQWNKCSGRSGFYFSCWIHQKHQNGQEEKDKSSESHRPTSLYQP